MGVPMNESESLGRARPTSGGLSAQAAKQAVYDRGQTLKQFAKDHGFSYRLVSEVVRGVNKGRYGEGHRVAVALGMKRG